MPVASRWRASVSVFALILLFCPVAQAEQRLIQIIEHFDQDPGWEGLNNRVVAENDGPTIAQNFGYRAGSHFGLNGSPGEIGGIIWRTCTPAYYAMKLKPLSLNDRMAASGKLVVMPGKHWNNETYIGFFNSTRQGWRPWNSLAVRGWQADG